jgi:hypothetical protein
MRYPLLALALSLLGPWGRASAREPAPRELTRVPLERLRVTQGSLRPGAQGRLTVQTPKVRAVAPATTTPVAELRLTYLGPTEIQQALASGEPRQQVGLKLRARDGCNVVYVMWRIAPRPGLVVSVKSNPDERTSSGCGNRGYQTVRPYQRRPVPEIVPGVPHTLRADWEGRALRVRVDGVLAWEGTLPPEALSLEGPVGLRTDNGRFELELLALQP